MPEEVYKDSLDVAQLLLDVQNPRLPSLANNQRDAIRAMIDAQKEKIVALAQHIANHGLNPASLPIVMPSEEDKGTYWVLDGNRRVVALKLLENPRLSEGILGGSTQKKLRELSREYLNVPVSQLDCIVVPDRDEADTWIKLIHRGQNQGAGLVEWDGQVAARYDSRRGSKPFALQVLDFVSNSAGLSKTTRERIENGKFPITSLTRLLHTPYVRKKLGIDKENGEAISYYPDTEVLKGLSRVVEDIGCKAITVSDIKRQEQRIEYINGFDHSELPNAATRFSPPQPLGERSGSAQPSPTKSKPTGKSKTARRRHTLIPGSCKLSIRQPRLSRLYRELKRLRVDDFPNATAVLLRVFIELGLDHYLEQVIKWPEQQIDGSTLAHKLSGVANDLEKKNRLTKNQLAPVYKAAGGQTLLASSVKTMHAYVHNKYFSPVASELKTAWDDLQPFIEQLWEVV